MKIENYDYRYFKVNGLLYRKRDYVAAYQDVVVDGSNQFTAPGNNVTVIIKEKYTGEVILSCQLGLLVNSSNVHYTQLSDLIEDLKIILDDSSSSSMGPTGPTGPQGPAGPSGLYWQGQWQSNNDYNVNDAVGFDGASYFCINAVSGSTESPYDDPSNWALLASQGAVGPTGPTGATGLTGPQGPQGPQGTASSQTLQQTVNLGNTVTNGDFTLSVFPDYIDFVNEYNYHTSYAVNGIQYNDSVGNIQAISFPPTISGGSKVIEFPNSTGIVALRSDITLQKIYDTSSNTMTSVAGSTTIAPSSISVSNSSGSTGISVGTITLTNNLYSVDINHPGTFTDDRTLTIPDASGTIALKNYKSYVALVSQSGTSSPTDSVLFNDTSSTFTWSYVGVGSYRVTCSNPLLLSGKTVMFITSQGNPSNGQNKIFGGTRVNNTTAAIFTSANGVVDLNLEIRIYN